MNQHVKKFCNKYDITEKQYYGEECICKSLIIDEEKIPKGFNPKTKYNLIANNVKKILWDFSPIIEGDLFLTNVKKILGNFSPTVCNNLHLINLEEISENFNPIVLSSLYMDKIKKVHSNFSLTVGFTLTLGGLEEIPENFNPTIGHYLHLNKIKELPNNFNPKVGQLIRYNYRYDDICSYIGCDKYTSINKPPSLLSWKNGKYILVDGIFREVEWKKGKVYKLKNIYCSNRDLFLVTDGKGTYAHGLTIKEAKEDLFYKISRNINSYKSLKLNSKLSYEKAIECYRAITGACKYGVQNFIETNNIKSKSYTIKEIIKITKNQYRNDIFKKFFKKYTIKK